MYIYQLRQLKLLLLFSCVTSNSLWAGRGQDTSEEPRMLNTNEFDSYPSIHRYRADQRSAQVHIT